jgi:hypothetical protein
MRTETGVMSLTTSNVPARTQPTTSLHQRNTAEGIVGTTVTCVMSSTTEMHAIGSKIGTESKSAWNKNNAMRGTMIIMVPTMTNLTGTTPLKEGII